MIKKDSQIRVERRVGYVNVACLATMIVLAGILAVRLSLFTDCPSCFFADSLLNKVILYVIIGLIIGYMASIPIMIYKVRQGKKITDDDCDEGSCSY